MIVVDFRLSGVAVSALEVLLRVVSLDFHPPLHHIVDIPSFVTKLINHAEIGVAASEQGVAGMIAVYCNNLQLRKAYITLLAVHPEMRGKGIGTRLLAYGLRRAWELGMTSIEVRTWADNETALRQYRRFGFQISRQAADRADGSLSTYLCLDLCERPIDVIGLDI